MVWEKKDGIEKKKDCVVLVVDTGLVQKKESGGGGLWEVICGSVEKGRRRGGKWEEMVGKRRI